MLLLLILAIYLNLLKMLGFFAATLTLLLFRNKKKLESIGSNVDIWLDTIMTRSEFSLVEKVLDIDVLKEI